MKALVVNLQNPGLSKYINPKSVGAFMLGKRLSNYIVNLVDFKTGECKFTIDFTGCDGDVLKIQAMVDSYYEHFSGDEHGA